MTIDVLDQLAALVQHEGQALLSRWRHQVRQLPSAQRLDVPTLNDHIPGLLDELAAALQSRSAQTIPQALSESSPPAHGLQRLQDAFDIEEVVAEYNILRGCIHDLADDNGLSLQGRPFHIVNRVFDQAIGFIGDPYGEMSIRIESPYTGYVIGLNHMAVVNQGDALANLGIS